MKLTLTYVSTLNGKITKGSDDNVTKWSSKEDKEHFKKIKEEFPVIIRSSSTYEIVKSSVQKDSEKRHIIMTRNPEKYFDQKSSNIEFTSESPKNLVDRLEKEGVEKALLAVGGKIVSMFLGAGLIDEFQLTLEPKIFGSGVNMVAEEEFEQEFRLISSEKLNEQGTLLLTYQKIE